MLNNGDGSQTADIAGITSDIYLKYNGTTAYTDVTKQYTGGGDEPTTLPECAKWIDGHWFCYFEGNSTYSAPNAWIWGDQNVNFTGGTWPGQALKSVGKAENGHTVYLWDGGAMSDKVPTGVVFSTGSGAPQTSDFIFTNGGYYNENGIMGTVVKPADPGLKGDVNGDGEVDVTDINAVMNAILSGINGKQYDVNGDGTIDITDVNTVLNIILKK